MCVFSQMKDTKHIRWNFHSVPWVMHAPGFGTWGAGGVKNLILWSWSCGISNQRGWAVDHDTLKIFTLGSNWWPRDGVKGSNTVRYLRERGDLRWRVIECVLVVINLIMSHTLGWRGLIQKCIRMAIPF